MDYTTEYAIDISKTEKGYTVKQYKMYADNKTLKGNFHFQKEYKFKNEDEIIEFVTNFPLHPSGFINELVLEIESEHDILNETEQKLIDAFLRLKNHIHKNIRDIICAKKQNK